MTDPNGVISNLTYDALGRLKTVTVDPSGIAAVTNFEYDALGQITKVTRPNGAYLQYTWDDARRLTRVDDNSGAYVEYDRDAMGGITARRIKSSAGTTLLSQTATYDELGRLLTFVGAATQTWTRGYDKTDNLTSITDPRSNVYGYAFDALNRLIRGTILRSQAQRRKSVTRTRGGWFPVMGNINQIFEWIEPTSCARRPSPYSYGHSSGIGVIMATTEMTDIGQWEALHGTARGRYDSR